MSSEPALRSTSIYWPFGGQLRGPFAAVAVTVQHPYGPWQSGEVKKELRGPLSLICSHSHSDGGPPIERRASVAAGESKTRVATVVGDDSRVAPLGISLSFGYEADERTELRGVAAASIPRASFEVAFFWSTIARQ